MMHVRLFCLVILSLVAIGCTSVSSSKTRSPLSRLAAKVDTATQPMRNSWKRVASRREQAPAPNWDWKSAIPTGVPRAELLTASIPDQAVAHFLPELQDRGVRLVSTHSQPAPLRIVNVDGMRIDNCNDLYVAADRAVEADNPVQIDLMPHVSGSAAGASVEIAPATLVALSQTAADNQLAMRIAEDGNLWAVVRDGGVRAKMTVRVERERGLLQVVLSLINCWGDQMLLPVDVQASCDGVRLPCLTVAQTLETLYETNKAAEPPMRDERSYSFAAVSEREDFLIPFNYQALVEQSADRQAVGSMRPAFASFSGVSYPGPAVLGDARALSGFMLQRNLLGVKGGERTGWVVFGGEELRTGSLVAVALDLGQGLRSYAFQLP